MKIKTRAVRLILLIVAILIMCGISMRLSIDPKPWLTTQHGQEVLEVLTHYWQVKSANSYYGPLILSSPSVREYTDICAIVVVDAADRPGSSAVVTRRIYRLQRENSGEVWRVALENHIESIEDKDYQC
jgi:hypothetical protein